MHRRQSQRGASSWERKRDPVPIALSVVFGDRPAQLLRVERFGLRHLGDCHQHHQNFFISHGHNLPFTCRKTACFVSFSRFTAVGSLSQTPVVFSRVTLLTNHRARSVTGFPKDAGGPFAARAHATRKASAFPLLPSEIIPCLVRRLARFKREQGQTETDDL